MSDHEKKIYKEHYQAFLREKEEKKKRELEEFKRSLVKPPKSA